MRLMIDVAQNQKEGHVALKDIAQRQDVSKKYLEQVVAPLVANGLLTVTRGNLGGYRLAKPAEEITLGQIVDASEGGIELLECASDSAACNRSQNCASRRIWNGLTQAIHDYLDNQTLAEIAFPNNDE